MNEYPLNIEKINKLNAVIPELHKAIQILENVVNEDIIKLLNGSMNNIIEVMNDYNCAQEDVEQENYNKLSQIAKNNNLQTSWSVTEVPANQMNNEMPYKIEKLIYGRKSLDIGKQITWLEVWKLANVLILAEGNDHIFIEGFKLAENGSVTIYTGS
jgi:hypothetical protein